MPKNLNSPCNCRGLRRPRGLKLQLRNVLIVHMRRGLRRPRGLKSVLSAALSYEPMSRSAKTSWIEIECKKVSPECIRGRGLRRPRGLKSLLDIVRACQARRGLRRPRGLKSTNNAGLLSVRLCRGLRRPRGLK